MSGQRLELAECFLSSIKLCFYKKKIFLGKIETTATFFKIVFFSKITRYTKTLIKQNNKLSNNHASI